MSKSSKRAVPKPQMEVYSASQGRSAGYNALPSPLTSFVGMLVAGSVTGVAYFVGDRWFDGRGTLWAGVAIGCMTVIAAVAFLISRRRARKKAEEDQGGFESALRSSSTGWDMDVSSPAEIARLDDLRANFQKGIQAFVDYGKDLYSLPWYVIVGESGGGKSEAIRRSELRFPDALQDKLQGTGGTYSMNWWFTNHAVILDTAGAMLMESAAASRFQEFLGLLRAHRPACPINGMILTIPVDSLLQDPPHVAEEKARTIAAQLSAIQQALDVRFPVYVMVSKSDRLPGFREYFDAEGQAGFERQMLGWANPAPLDSEYSSNQILGAVDALALRLQSRAWALLENVIPVEPSGRRLDEVDLIYGFPQMLRTLAPRLRLYLDVVFQTGTWAKKAPFFRGIFFTSALREGAQLDQQLAQALGMPLERLPPGGFFAREKSVFLRDFFLEKVFPESGLVTRLFDVGAHLRKRLMIFYGATAAILLVSLGFAWMVKNRIEDQLHRDQLLWAAANESWSNGCFMPVVVRSASFSNEVPDRPAWRWSGMDKVRADQTVLNLLQELRSQVDTPVRLGWVFKPIGEWQDFVQRRKLGYVILLEGSVLKPVLDAVRERILWDTAQGATTSPETQIRMANALKQMVQLEVWLHASRAKKPTAEDWQEFFTSVMAYLFDPAPPGGWPDGKMSDQLEPAEDVPQGRLEDLVNLVSDAFDHRVQMEKRSWMSESSLVEGKTGESPIVKAANFIFGKTKQVAEGNDQRIAALAAAKSEGLQRISGAERVLLNMARNPSGISRNTVENEGLRPLREAITAFEAIMEQDGRAPRSALSMTVVSSTARDILDAVEKTADRTPESLAMAAQVAENIEGGAAGPKDSMAGADLQWAEAHKRLAHYEENFEAISLNQANLSMESMIGNLGQKLKNALAKARELAGSGSAGTGEGGEPTMEEQILLFLSSLRGTPLVGQVFKNYEQSLLTFLNPRLKFPLVLCDASYDSLYVFQAECKNLERIQQDMMALSTLTEPAFQCEEKQKIEEIFGRLHTIFGIKQALLGSGTGGGLRLEVDAVEPPKQMSKQQEIVDPNAATGFFAPEAPKSSVIETIQEGFISLKISVGGSIKVQGPPTGVNKSVEYNGFDPVAIELRFARPAPENEIRFTFESPASSRWYLLRKVAETGNKTFSVSGSRKNFSLESSPALPAGLWPKRRDLGLPDNPPSP